MTFWRGLTLCLLFLSCYLGVKAQLVYTDLMPDVVKTNWDEYTFHLEKEDSSLTTANEGVFVLWKHPGDIAINSYKSTAQVLMIQKQGKFYAVKLSHGDGISAGVGYGSQRVIIYERMVRKGSGWEPKISFLAYVLRDPPNLCGTMDGQD